jgi:hypothetical protein
VESRFERDDDAHGCSSVLRIQNRLTTVNKPAEADLLRHSTRGKGHIGQVIADPESVRRYGLGPTNLNPPLPDPCAQQIGYPPEKHRAGSKR